MAREFGVHAEPMTLHSPVPELLAGAWSLCREQLVAAGRVERAVKEAVAMTVSSINSCPFCVDAHAVMLAASGHSGAARRLERGKRDGLDDPALERVVEWAAATRSPGSPVLGRPPFDAVEAPEMIGTAVLFHYINRPVTVFLGETSPLPLGGRLLKGGMLRAGARRLRAFARARPIAGESLELLPEAKLPDDLAWASGSPVLAGAWARFAAATERAGERSLPAEVRSRLLAQLDEWRGGDPGLGVAWLERALEGLDQRQIPAARLALLVALAPYRVDEQVVDAFRAGAGPEAIDADARLVGAVSWSALAAARRIGSWLAVAEPAVSGRTVMAVEPPGLQAS
jgi:AhpD family alkylhydroperoxidase